MQTHIEVWTDKTESYNKQEVVLGMCTATRGIQ
jgi:hypothetical protein